MNRATGTTMKPIMPVSAFRHSILATHEVFQGVHGSREPGCDKHGVNAT